MTNNNTNEYDYNIDYSKITDSTNLKSSNNFKHQTIVKNDLFKSNYTGNSNNNNNKDRLSSSSITTNNSSILDHKLISSSASFSDDAIYYGSKNKIKKKNNSFFKYNKNNDKRETKERNRTRFDIALLGLAIAAVNCYAQATFCIAIVEMVLPADFVIKNSDIILSSNNDSVVKLGLASTTKSATLTDVPINLVIQNPSSDLIDNEKNNFHLDESCPIEYKYRDYYDSWRFPSLNEKNSQSRINNTQLNITASSENYLNFKTNSNSNNIDISNRFNWDASQQGLLLGAFAIGTAPLQVVAGRLAEIYGSKWVLLIGCLGTALTNLSIPFLAKFSFILLLLNRVLMGIAQAGMEPGLMCLLAEWLTPAEAGLYISMLLFAMCIGFFLGSLCSSFILSIGYGWPLAYYVSGGFNLLIGIVWFLYANSKPEESKIISKEELAFIRLEQGKILNNKMTTNKQVTSHQDEDKNDLYHNNNSIINCDNNNKLEIINSKFNLAEPSECTRTGSGGSAPWLKILSTRSVWAFIICKFSIRWCADVLSIELPTYLANVLHLSIRLNGILNSISSALFAIFSFLAGYLANEILIKQQKRVMENNKMGLEGERKFVLSKTNLRKIVQSIASFGSAITIFLMTKYDCNIILSMSMLLILSCCLVMGTGGELQIPYDMTPRYPGTLHGMACTMSISGWFAPPMIGLILADQPNSRYRWSIVWYLTAFINLFGGLVFVLFADASPRDFDNDNSKDSLNNNDNVAHSRRKNTTNKSSNDNDNVDVINHKEKDGASYGQKGNDLSLYLKETKNHENWSPFFDRELIKIRQVEDSYIKRPGYFNDEYDSIITHKESDIIYPYKVIFGDCKQTNLDKKLNQSVKNGSRKETAHETNKSFLNFLRKPFRILFQGNTVKSEKFNSNKLDYCLGSQRKNSQQQQQHISTSSSSLSSISNIEPVCCDVKQQAKLDSSNNCHNNVDNFKQSSLKNQIIGELPIEERISIKNNCFTQSNGTKFIAKQNTKTITHL